MGADCSGAGGVVSPTAIAARISSPGDTSSGDIRSHPEVAPGDAGSARCGRSDHTLPIQDGWNVLDDNLLACPEHHVRSVFGMLQSAGTPRGIHGRVRGIVAPGLSRSISWRASSRVPIASLPMIRRTPLKPWSPRRGDYWRRDSRGVRIGLFLRAHRVSQGYFRCGRGATAGYGADRLHAPRNVVASRAASQEKSPPWSGMAIISAALGTSGDYPRDNGGLTR